LQLQTISKHRSAPGPAGVARRPPAHCRQPASFPQAVRENFPA